MFLLVGQLTDGQARGFLIYSASGIKQKINKQSNFQWTQKCPGTSNSLVHKVLHLLYKAVWTLKQGTILWLTYKYNLGSGQYNFNLYDILKVKVIHYKTWVNQSFKNSKWFYQHFLSSILDLSRKNIKYSIPKKPQNNPFVFHNFFNWMRIMS